MARIGAVVACCLDWRELRLSGVVTSDFLELGAPVVACCLDWRGGSLACRLGGCVSRLRADGVRGLGLQSECFFDIICVVRMPSSAFEPGRPYGGLAVVCEAVVRKGFANEVQLSTETQRVSLQGVVVA
jgi:hypothetical protein